MGRETETRAGAEKWAPGSSFPATEPFGGRGGWGHRRLESSRVGEDRGAADLVQILPSELGHSFHSPLTQMERPKPGHVGLYVVRYFKTDR